MNRTNAFSLVELSIVLVILGLLVGGILAGQSLIRAAELRSVSSEYQRYDAAVNAFRDKYFAVPGDMKNATSIWGDDNTNCPDAAITNGTPGTCNGNGDGFMNQGAAVSVTAEVFQFWKQLALAGLVEGSYTGLAGPTTGNNGLDSILGTNAPRSKLSGGGWTVRNLANYAGDTVTYSFSYQNVFNFGAQTPGDTTINGILKPEEAWNIDTKMDDGKPGSGKVLARSMAAWSNANACSLSTSLSDYTGAYNLGANIIACSFFFPRAF